MCNQRFIRLTLPAAWSAGVLAGDWSSFAPGGSALASVDQLAAWLGQAHGLALGQCVQVVGPARWLKSHDASRFGAGPALCCDFCWPARAVRLTAIR